MSLLTPRRGAAVVCALLVSMGVPLPAFAASFKLAYWNIKSGKGAIALPGRPATFADTDNCTDTALPLNAWGVGLVQQKLVAKIKNEPAIVALGLGEAWTTVCGSPENVRAVLGWAARTGEQNGVAVVARYGFAGPATWTQLDTSLTTTPSDTMWVVRTPVCLDPACTTSFNMFTAHWGGGSKLEKDIQAQQTRDAMAAAIPAGVPHALVGDLNVWEGTTSVCNQLPQNTALGFLRDAGYIDAWLSANGSIEGYTGMANRAGCGVPEGYTWKRVDYAWSKNIVPVSMTRFGMMTPGDGSPSDHYGIIAEYAPPPPPPGTDNTAPTASISWPAPNGTVSGITSVTVSAVDNIGVARVDLLLDGVVVG